MLGGDHHARQAHRAVPVVADGDLRLAVGAQARHDALLAHGCQSLGQAVGQVDRQRHELGRVRAGVAEHEALVPRPLEVERVEPPGAPGSIAAHLERLVHTRRDVRGLLADRDRHAAGGAVKADLGGRVADRHDLGAHDLGDLDVGVGGDLPGDVDEPRGHHRLDGHVGDRVLSEDGIENGVRDAVADLVGVPLGDGL